MAYELAEDQELLRDTIRRLAREKALPRAAEVDKSDEYPFDMLELFRENDLMGIDFPVEYGGSGAGCLSLCIVIEELAKVSASIALIPGCQELGSMPIILAGNEDQKRKYLPRLAKGEWLAAFGLTEPESGSDAGAIRTKAIKHGDRYILDGQKCFITNGGLADVYTIFARTDPGVKGVKGISCFVVEKDTPGFSIGKHEDKMGVRGLVTSELFFEDCSIPKENLLGEEGKGFTIAMKTLDFTRPVVASQALGIAQGAFDYAFAYARERKQFGSPIAALQGIQFMAADIITRIEAGRQLLYRAASLLQKQPKDLSRLAPEVTRFSSMAKLFCSEMAMRVTVDAVQLMGGYGYMKEFPLERMMRDAKITQIYEGTSQIQKIVIAGTLLA